MQAIPFKLFFSVLVLGLTACQSLPERAEQDHILKAVNGDHRSAENRARDVHRRPVETLEFWGLEPDMTVLEVWPGGGWYSEILGPALRDKGQLVVANFPLDARPDWRAAMARDFVDMIESSPAVYGDVKVVPFQPPRHTTFGEPESLDMVILSRHFHNFIRGGIVDQVLAASMEALKPGGVLAIVQHRAQPDATPEGEERTGYVREAWLVEKVESAGFELEASSPLNHNPKDSRDHDAGVWSLPPSLRGCRSLEDSQRSGCIEKYREIGESDRMTLRFRRP
ncbi:MAG: class I SAM-dependent methyltransferase [Pseudomonadota bacterium]